MKQLFNRNLNNFTKNQKLIANFVENNITRIIYMTESEIAKEVKISTASVSRFWGAVGYKNFKEFKQSLVEKHHVNPAYKMQSLINKIEKNDLPFNMLELAEQYLADTSTKLSRESFYNAVAAIKNARQIHVFAPGISSGLADLLRFRLRRYGLWVNHIEKGGNELFESLMHLTEVDLMIVFAFSTVSLEAQVILDLASKIGFKTLFITDVLVSDIIGQADITLYSYRGPMWEFHSMVAPTALVESLIVGVGMENQETTIEKLEYLNRLRKQYASLLPK